MNNNRSWASLMSVINLRLLSIVDDMMEERFHPLEESFDSMKNLCHNLDILDVVPSLNAAYEASIIEPSLPLLIQNASARRDQIRTMSLIISNALQIWANEWRAAEEEGNLADFIGYDRISIQSVALIGNLIYGGGFHPDTRHEEYYFDAGEEIDGFAGALLDSLINQVMEHSTEDLYEISLAQHEHLM